MVVAEWSKITQTSWEEWNHYAFSMGNSGSQTELKFYVNGDLVEQLQDPDQLEEVNFTFGSLGAGIRTFGGPKGDGKTSGSFDEFRFWKTERSSEDIGKYWFTQVGGGTNTDDANTDLGIYYKFNEGITGQTATDSIVLDYSGRISNGSWVGYPGSQARSIDSAIIESSASLEEFRDPIIYPSHPAVVALQNELRINGSFYDAGNNNSLYKTIPSWITEEDEETSDRLLLKMTQIMGSYLDTLFLQIKEINAIRDKTYISGTNKPLVFADRLLEGQSFVAPEIFAEASILSQIMDRNDDINFDLDLSNIKNLIYKNIYNNLSYIYKTKGTTKSFRNLLRCYGVDEELIRLNLYANNLEYRLEDDKYRATTTKRRLLDFNNPSSFGSTLYQQSSSIVAPFVKESFISGNASFESTAFTLESEVLFPKKLTAAQPGYFPTRFLSASVFGFHGVDSSLPEDFTWTDTDMRVYAVRTEEESSDVKFVLTSSNSSILLETEVYDGIYDNERWNLSIRFGPSGYGSDIVSDSLDEGYDLRFSGYNVEGGIIKNEFHLTSALANTAPTKKILNSAKKIYAGSHRQNFTGSILQETDIKLSSVRYWGSHLADKTISAHAKDIENKGTLSPLKNTYLYVDSLDDIRIPQMETLFLDWEFLQVTSSDASGKFVVQDLSSGDAEQEDIYGFYSQVSKRAHPGQGEFFAPSDDSVVENHYLYSAKQLAPDLLQEQDMINILSQDDITFTRETRPIEYYYAFEKSMYQNINDEILNFFATVADFNNLVGDPVNRYRGRYKNMEALRQLFFERVENTPDLDKFIDFYKWIDGSLGEMLLELIPASANFSEKIRNVVESHTLERDKYRSKFPLFKMNPKGVALDIEPTPIMGGTSGELGGDLNETYLVEGTCRALQKFQTDSTNEELRKKYGRALLGQCGPRATPTMKIVDLGASTRNTDYYEASLHPGATTEIILKKADLQPEVEDSYDPRPSWRNDKDIKEKVGFGIHKGEEKLSGDMVSKFSLYRTKNPSAAESVLGDITLTNYHSDTYGNGFDDFSAPAQGTFTEEAVGGSFYRHVDLFSEKADRAEPWVAEASSDEIKFTSQPLSLPRSTYYRDLIAKSPMSVKNIKINSLGNYKNEWEIVHSMGRRENSIQFVKDGGFDLAVEYISSSFPGSPLSNIEKIVRGRYESVFVNRFSSPGSPSTMGDADGAWGLDRYSAELSPNNDLNTRNSLVRNIYRDILSSHVNQFGYFSATNVRNTTGSTVSALDYGGTASPYQVNRNAEYRPNPAYAPSVYSTSSVNFATASLNQGGYRISNTAALRYLPGVDDFSIAVWVKQTAVEDDPATLRPIISYAKESGGTYTILWGIWAQNGKFYAGIDATGTSITLASSTHILESPLGEHSLDTWYLLVLNSTPGLPHEAQLGFTVGNVATGQLTRSTSTFLVAGAVPIGVSPEAGRIGPTVPNTLMNMEMDDVSIYNINLSEAQVNDIFTCGPNDITQFFAASDIEAHVLMGDSSVDTFASLLDATGNGHNFRISPLSATNLSLVNSKIILLAHLNLSAHKTYDNYYVQHNIPRNDYRYAWITASTISDQCLTAARRYAVCQRK